MLKIQEFARRGGVSIRTLRHYDHLGLLKPAARSKSGYRLYEDADIKRLEQIIALRAFGLSLTNIGRALKKASALSNVLEQQLRTLVEQRRIVTDAIEAVTCAQRDLLNGGSPDWRQLASLVKHGGEASRLDQARRQVMDRRRQWTPSPEDLALMRDLKAAIDRNETRESPAWPTLVERVKEAIERFTGGDRELQAAYRLVMSDTANWPQSPVGGKYKEFFDEAMDALTVVH